MPFTQFRSKTHLPSAKPVSLAKARCRAGLMAIGLLCAAPAFASPSVGPLNDTLLQALQQHNGVPGMSAAIIKDGKLVWQGSVGFADRARKIPVTSTTVFRLASVSKFVTALMLARLAEQDKIELSAPARHYLPDYPETPYPFTVQQLTNHTSGIAHYSAILDAARDDREQPFVTVSEGVDLFKNRPLAHRPGSAYLYSSYGFNLLSAVMERAAKEDFDTMLDTLSKRAGAPSLTVELPGPMGANWSRLYDTEGNELPRGNISYNRAGGGMLSNAHDLARVGQLALDEQFISRATLKRFTTPGTLANGERIKDGRFTLGVGFRLSVDQAGRSFFHHSGITRGARSHISVYPEQGLIVALLSNASWVAAMDSTASALAEPLLSELPKAACKTGTYAYEGQYKSKSITGVVRIAPMGAVCKAVLVADNALGAWMANGASSREYSLYGVSQGMSLVTPIGLFPATISDAAMTLDLMDKPVTLRLTQGPA